MVTALVDPQKNLSEFWTAIGNKLRPSITVTATISVDVTVTPETAPIVITERLQMGERVASGEEKIIKETREESFLVGGQVTDRNATAVKGATVTLVGLGVTASTDREGRYVLGMMNPGSYTLQAKTNGTTAEKTITVPAERPDNYDVQLT
jgi:hypothetical protein